MTPPSLPPLSLRSPGHADGTDGSASGTGTMEGTRAPR